ncbi:MAG TPA: N-acetyltransferase [Candidatus Blautia stercoravium]|nr:N-acetyltransferase [Candidatus Blautia stercoravium]
MNFVVKENIIYYVDENGEKAAEVTFPSLDEHTVEINHTFVAPSLRGTGMAGKLMQAAAEEISRQGKRAVLTCSYAKGWFEHHKEFQHMIQE